jgi:hypothetical protein
MSLGASHSSAAIDEALALSIKAKQITYTSLLICFLTHFSFFDQGKKIFSYFKLYYFLELSGINL